MTAKITVDDDTSTELARERLEHLVLQTPLCTIATSSSDGMPNAATAFFVFEAESLLLHVLTGPDTVHGKHIQESGLAFINICSTQQEWMSDKQGAQLGCDAYLTPPDQVASVLELYLSNYSGLQAWIATVDDLNSIDSRFFTFAITKFKLFDEPTFGKEVWVSGTVKRV